MSDGTPQNGGGESRATMGVCAVVTVLAIVFVSLRFYTRLFTHSGLWWDDWLMAAAIFFLVTTEVLLVVANSIDPDAQWLFNNMEADYEYNAKDQLDLKLAFIASVLYFSIAGTTKLGILMMYYRIFSVDRRCHWWLVTASALVIAFWIGCTVATLTNCIPLKWSWIGNAGQQFCFNFNIFWMASGVCEIMLDVMILTLPIHFVMKLHLSRRKKIYVAGIFLLGGFIVITGMVKTILGYVPGGLLPSYSRTEIWTTVHTAVSIACANLPILQPFVKRVANTSWPSQIRTLSASWRASRRFHTPMSSPQLVAHSPIPDNSVPRGPVIETKSSANDEIRMVSIPPSAAHKEIRVEYYREESPMLAKEIADTLADDYGIYLHV